MNNKKHQKPGNRKPGNASQFDLMIIGGGVTGLAAAMYAGRLHLKTLVLGSTTGSEMPIGGTITLTEIVENYPGFLRTSGPELAEQMRNHAEDYSEYVAIREERVVDVQQICETSCFAVITEKHQYSAKTIIFATGTQWRKLDIKGAEEFENRGVQYCALCDGPLYRDQAVAIIGGSDTAVKEALLLAKYAKKVFVIYRGEKLRAEPVNAKRIENEPKIEVICCTHVVEIRGNKVVESIVMDKAYKGEKEMKVDGVFGAIGNIPLSHLAKKLDVNTNDKQEIIIDHRDSSTNIPGVFAAGDVTDKEFKQIATGAAEGVLAAYSAYKYVNENEFVCIFYDEQYR
ncbi:MAG: FAD-dependent oxidoreductase [Deltaproteobacteria bacterium]|nr:FAD-dependent oxidoreductase [Deltaproteobacteria bacterium]MBW2306733.1 FAD-dependent oxidoreductase [Deltaproteobacteria bacterium]